MEVQFSPEVQAKLDKLVIETGRPAGEFIQDAVAGYVEELTHTFSLIEGRYDDLASGKETPVNGDEVIKRLRAKSNLRRSNFV